MYPTADVNFVQRLAGAVEVSIPLPVEGRPNRRGQPILVFLEPRVLQTVEGLEARAFQRAEQQVRRIVAVRMEDYDPDGLPHETFHIQLGHEVLDA